MVRTDDECGRHHTLFSQPPVALTEKSWETVHQAWRSHFGNGGAMPQGILCGTAFSTSQEESSRARKSQDFLS